MEGAALHFEVQAARIGLASLARTKDTRWISAFVEARPSEDYPPHWYFEDVQFLVSLINFQDRMGVRSHVVCRVCE